MWETEVGTLKHELWQTIQAHNHNSDLLKHHKEAIDQIQARISEAAPNPELEAVQAQIEAQLLQANKIVQREKDSCSPRVSPSAPQYASKEAMLRDSDMPIIPGSS